uniref:CABIT domain-containing protein n=1 Tax=Anopheles farauti TaxID=69004 RepID=A0A182QCP8_9DIPT
MPVGGRSTVDETTLAATTTTTTTSAADDSGGERGPRTVPVKTALTGSNIILHRRHRRGPSPSTKSVENVIDPTADGRTSIGQQIANYFLRIRRSRSSHVVTTDTGSGSRNRTNSSSAHRPNSTCGPLSTSASCSFGDGHDQAGSGDDHDDADDGRDAADDDDGRRGLRQSSSSVAVSNATAAAANMAATDGQIILAASRFAPDTPPAYLRDFAKSELPAVGKIVKGQYYSLGVPTLSNPSLQSTALFLNAGRKYQILAQPVKIKEGRKNTNVGPKVLIPETYPGYFELLSEDGRSTRCIESVLELSRRRNFRVLVRETVRCNHNSKSLHAGEILTTISDNGKYLQCRTSKDELVSLPLEAKAKFSPIAKEDSISGVHTVRNLLQKRMPVTVRLVHGAAPKGLKQPFVPELRLLGCVEVDRIFALPLQKDMDLVSVPLNAKIKIQRAKNMEQLDHFIEYSRFLDKAHRLLVDARDRLQIIDLKLTDKEKKDSAKAVAAAHKTMASTLSGLTANGYVLKKSSSCDSNRYSPEVAATGSGGGGSQNGSIADEYDEIDQIYDYVRGLAPLPKNLYKFEAIEPPPPATTSGGGGSSPTTGATTPLSNTLGLGLGLGLGPATHQHSLKTVENMKTAQSNALNNNNHYDTSNNNYCNIIKYSNQTQQQPQQLQQQSQLHHGGSHHHHHHAHHHHGHPGGHHHTASNSLESTSKHASAALNAINNNNSSNSHHHHHHHSSTVEHKPIPPPIETIPGKKLPEKRQRPTLPKLYFKSNIGLHQKSPTPGATAISPMSNGGASGGGAGNAGGGGGGGGGVVHHPPIAITPKEIAVEPQSPLFHIRYKSLSSLQLAAATPPQDAHPAGTPISPSPKGQDKNHLLSKSASAAGPGGGREGTLDSSRSGGRTSGDSGKLPEKKSRRLSRPRSLSNLVWDLRPHKSSTEKTKKKLYLHQFDRQQGTLYL